MNEKELFKRCFVCVILFVLCATAVFYIIGTRTNIHNNGNGTNAARDEFKHIEETQRTERKSLNETEKSINRGINRVEKSETAVTNSQERIESSKQTNREIASVERADAEIIAECEQILARVRKRATTEN